MRDIGPSFLDIVDRILSTPLEKVQALAEDGLCSDPEEKLREIIRICKDN